MPTLIANADINQAVVNHIQSAGQFLLLVSPHWGYSEDLLKALQRAEHNVFNIHLIYGNEGLQPEVRQKLSELTLKSKKIKIYFYKNLNVKCYISESGCIDITNFNFEFTKRTDLELGILFSVPVNFKNPDSPEDTKFWNSTCDEAAIILNASTLVDLNQKS